MTDVDLLWFLDEMFSVESDFFGSTRKSDKR